MAEQTNEMKADTGIEFRPEQAAKPLFTSGIHLRNKVTPGDVDEGVDGDLVALAWCVRGAPAAVVACGGRLASDATPPGTPSPDAGSLATDAGPTVDAAPATDGGSTVDAADCPTGSPCLVTLASGQNNAVALAVGPDAVYWVEWGDDSGKADGAVMKVPLDGGTPIVLASDRPTPSSIAVDATSVYWTDQAANYGGKAGGMVEKLPLAGGTAVTLASGQQNPGSIAVYGTADDAALT